MSEHDRKCYVGGRFQHDVFFSYAHGNDLLRDWSRKLAREICDTLGILLSDRERTLSFYTDEQLRLNEPLTSELRSHVQSSAALVVVITGHYLKSPWCADEGQWFQEISEAEPDHVEGMRFVIRAQHVTDAEWPPFLCDERKKPLPGYLFCDEEEGKVPWGMHETKLDKYGPAIAQISQQLAAYLKEKCVAAAESYPPEDLPKVLLGIATEDLEEERLALRDRLASGGHLEIIAPAWPETPDLISEVVQRAAEGCKALVQLCGRASGRWSHDSEGFVGFQIRLFEDTRRHVWLVPAEGLVLERLPASGYANLLGARAKDLKPAPEAVMIRATIDQNLRQGPLVNAAGEAPICAVFICSRREYEESERRLRRNLERLKGVSVYALPDPPIWELANSKQISYLLEIRHRLAANLDAYLLILSDRPELLNEDLLDYLREQRELTGAVRLPAAIIDVSREGARIIGSRLPVFKLGPPDSAGPVEAWLCACATRQRRPAA
jgi:hypothetical protein